MVVVRCAMSGEEPELGWASAALGTCLIIATFAIGAWANLVRSPNETLTNRHLLDANASTRSGSWPCCSGSCSGCRRWSRSIGPKTMPTSRQ